MKKLILFLFISTFFVANAQEDLLREANNFYKQEKYVEAVAMYDSIVATGYTSSAVYYNLGNSLYKLGQIAPCILNYERALQLAPNDKDISYNLELVQQHVVDELGDVDVFFLTRIVRNVRASQSSDTWAVWSIVSFSVALVLLLMFFLSSSTVLKRLGFYFSIITFVFALSTFSFSSTMRTEITTHDSAIVLDPTVTVTSSPIENGIKIFVLHEGTKVQIVDRLEGWVEIMLSDGNKGWMKESTIEEI